MNLLAMKLSIGEWVFNNKWVIIVAMVVVFGAFLLCIRNLLSKINPLIDNIKTLNQKIKQLKNSHPDYKNINTDIVHDIDNFISEQRLHEKHIFYLFRNKYKHFHNSLLEDETLLSDNQIRVKQYFRDTNTEQWINIKSIFHISSIYDNASGILTGLGLLLTFIFIAFGLSELKLNSSDTGAIQNGISSLVGNLTGKFISSILGIGTAILYTLIYSSRYHKLELAINAFCALIDDIIPIKSSNQLLSEIKKNNTDQTDSLKKFFQSGDFSNALQKALDGSNEGKILPVLHQINDRLAKSDIGEIFDTMKEFIKSISDKMNEVNQQQSSGLMESMYQLQKESNKYIDNISQKILQSSDQIQQNLLAQQNEVTLASSKHQQAVNENINSMLQQVSNKTSDILTTFSDYIAKNNHINQSLNDVVHQIIDKNNQTINTQTENIKQTDKALSYITATAESLKLITDNISNTSNSMIAATQSLQKINDSINMVHDSIINKSQLVQHGYEQLKINLESEMNLWKSTISDTNHIWQKNIESMKDNQQQINELMKTVNNVIETYSTKTDEKTHLFLNEFEKKLHDITGAIKTAMEEMTELADAINSSLPYLKEKSTI